MTDLAMNIQPCPDEDLELAYKKFRETFENFVFEGGGIRGIAFGGAIYYMDKHNLMKQIKRFAGSSAGAIVASVLAVGYSGKEVIKILHETDFKKFEDDSWGVVGDLYRILTKFGVYKGEAFEDWLEGVLLAKTGNPNITFLEVYKKYGKELVITGTCLNTCETHYYHYLTYPNMPIKKAVRISMSIPVFFASVKENNTVMVDGGLLNNYPIWVFDGDTIGDSHVSDEQIANSKTLGFKLMTDQEKQDYKLYHIDEKIDNIFQYSKALINSLLIQIERGHIRSGYWKKTVPINTHNVSSLQFTLPEETIVKLVQTGYDSIHEKLLDIQRQQLQQEENFGE
jgi:NTE family protein